MRRLFFTAAGQAARPDLRAIARLCAVAMLATCGGCRLGSDGRSGAGGLAASDVRSAEVVDRAGREDASSETPIPAARRGEPRRAAIADSEAVGCVERLLTSGAASGGPASNSPAAGREREVPLGWYRDLGAPDDPEAAEYRWRHAGLDQWLAANPMRSDDLRLAMQSEHAEVRATAQIGLARYAAEDRCAAAVEAMEAVVDDPRLAMTTRQAAVETLGHLSAQEATPTLERLAARHATRPQDRPARTERATPYLPPLHGELLRSLGRQRAPSLGGHVDAALYSPSPDVRAAALSLLASDASIEPATDLAMLLADGDPRVRAAAFSALAARNRDDVVPAIEEATGDVAPQVRLAAVAALGQIGSPRAQDALRRLLEHRDETLRGATVAALAALGDRQGVYRAAGDTSWRVRREVARAVASDESNEAESIARTLLADESIEVQARAVESIARWSPARAVPLLLTAAQSPIRRTRLAAVEELRNQWQPAADLNGDDPPQRRAEKIALLQRAWEEQFAAASRTAAATTSGTTPYDRSPGAAATVAVEPNADGGGPTSGAMHQAAFWLNAYSPTAAAAERAEAGDRLVALADELVPALEELVSNRGVTIDEQVYRHVLPRVDEEFAALEDLRAGDLARRRAAANWLAQRARVAPLRPLVVQRLADTSPWESDATVWHDLLAAVSGLQGEAADRLAYTGLLHRAASVRLAACNYLESNPSPRHASALEPLLSAVESDVVKAAAAALGQCGSRDAVPPLMYCLTSPDKSVRIEAAKALSWLGHSSGPAALERLSLDREASVRRQAALAMGELADPLFATALVRLLDDEPIVRRAPLAALPKATGYEIAPPEESMRDVELSQAVRWREWYRFGGRASANDN